MSAIEASAPSDTRPRDSGDATGNREERRKGGRGNENGKGSGKGKGGKGKRGNASRSERDEDWRRAGADEGADARGEASKSQSQKERKSQSDRPRREERDDWRQGWSSSNNRWDAAASSGSNWRDTDAGATGSTSVPWRSRERDDDNTNDKSNNDDDRTGPSAGKGSSKGKGKGNRSSNRQQQKHGQTAQNDNENSPEHEGEHGADVNNSNNQNSSHGRGRGKGSNSNKGERRKGGGRGDRRQAAQDSRGKEQKEEEQDDGLSSDNNGEDGAGRAADGAQGKERRGARKGMKGNQRGTGKGNENKQRPTRRPPAVIVEDPNATLAERLTQTLGSGHYDCMICISNISRSAPVWTCSACWAGFHLKCIHTWIERSCGKEGPEFAWMCPGCMHNHVGRLPEYECFCGKERDPMASDYLTAHSCGEPCQKKRGCAHPCTELCHPGPCPPCRAVGPPGSCHCGREESATTRCGDPPRWSCGETCGQTLPCGLHRCEARCHGGPCPPCSATSLQPCYCGASEEERLCGQEDFSCNNPCGMPLACGEHDCELACHPGECPPCKLEPEVWGDRCACGKTNHCSRESAAAILVRWVGKRQSCSDPLPICAERCKRRRDCGHECTKVCHTGPCGPCDALVTKDCRCGRMSQQRVCSDKSEVVCQQVCKTRKRCGNHKCDVVCCPGYNNRDHEDHFCLHVCGRPLRCGNHVCEDFCHLGLCPPCRIVSNVPLSCACGHTEIPPPIRCGVQPPPCDRQCDADLPCGHTCLSKCHFGEHPLCCQLVARPCLGGHRDMRHPCHVGTMSCGQACQKPLPCGHTCASTCHSGPCGNCTKACGKRRLHCQHTCPESCHPDTDCPSGPCRAKVKVACLCGKLVEERRCGAWSGAPHPEQPPPKCNSACTAKKSPPPLGPKGNGSTLYAKDLYRLGLARQRYVQTLEEIFEQVFASAGTPGGRAVTLPPCDGACRLLAVEYARLHWGLRTASKADAVPDWWLVRIEPAPGPANSNNKPQTGRPKPLLSSLLAASANDRNQDFLAPALSYQPRLRFTGVKGGGDEIYDLVGVSALLGVRPGSRDGEVFAFVEKSTVAVEIIRRLTQQPPQNHPTPVRVKLGPSSSAAPASSSSTGSAWGPGANRSAAAAAAAPKGAAPTNEGLGLRVMLDQSLVSGSGPAGGSSGAGGGGTDGPGASTGDGWDYEPKAEPKDAPPQEEDDDDDDVPDNWDDEDDEDDDVAA